MSSRCCFPTKPIFEMKFELVPAPIACLPGAWKFVILYMHCIALLLVVLALAPPFFILLALSLMGNKHARGSRSYSSTFTDDTRIPQSSSLDRIVGRLRFPGSFGVGTV